MYRRFCIWKISAECFQGNKQRNLPESEWLYAENTHEGIIDKELFRQVQEKIREFTEAYKKKHQLNNGAIRNHNFYTGKIRCGGCGNRMVLSREKQGHFIISVVQMRTINPEEISVRGTESKRIRG